MEREEDERERERWRGKKRRKGEEGGGERGRRRKREVEREKDQEEEEEGEEMGRKGGKERWKSRWRRVDDGLEEGRKATEGWYICSLSLPCLSVIIRRFALHNLCDLNPTCWAASVAQLVYRATALKAGGCGFKYHLSSLFFYENRRERELSGLLLPCLLLKSKFTCVYNYKSIFEFSV